MKRNVLILVPAVLGLTAAGLAGGAGGAGVMQGLVGVSLDSRSHAGLVVALGLGCVIAVVAMAWDQSRRVKAVTRAARRLLPADGSGGGGGGSVEGDGDLRPLGPLADDGLDGLRETITQLGSRMSRQVKETAKKSRNLEALIDGLDEPVLATDNADRVMLCNRAAEQLLDMGQGQLLGRGVRELFTRREIVRMHEQARAGRIERGQVPVVTPAGPRVFQVSAAPVPAAWGEGVFGSVIVLRDVTELASAVQVRTDFVANASHELRTPVANIRAAVETLRDGAADDPGMRDKLLRVIGTHAQRLEELVRDLMDLSRLESPDLPVRMEPVDMEEIAATLAGHFEEALRARRLSLAIDLDPGLTGLRTDRQLLLLILRNLIDNSTKFAFEGTAVRVTGRANGPAGEGGRTEARFTVADQGIGIPLSQQERVFERFYQVDPARTGVTKRGTGLGLSIVKHAAKALGGRVTLNSVWGQGTTVMAEVPMERD